MFEIVGGVLSIVIGIVMLLIGSSIISQISGSGSIGDCAGQDFNGDGATGDTKVKPDGTGVSSTANENTTKASVLDLATPAGKACSQTVNSGYTVIQIMSVMLIVGGVLISIRGYF